MDQEFSKSSWRIGRTDPNLRKKDKDNLKKRVIIISYIVILKLKKSIVTFIWREVTNRLGILESSPPFSAKGKNRP